MALGRSRVVLIFAVALAVRLAFVTTRGDDLSFPDSQDYNSIARNLVAGEGFREEVGKYASRAPGYPLFLAACYSAGLQSPKAIYAIQAVADSIACVLLALLGKRLFGEMAGAISGWIAAFYPFFIYFTGMLLAETLFILGLVAYILLLARCSDALQTKIKGLIGIAVAAGVLAGLLVLLRSSFLLFPFFLLPFWLWQSWKSAIPGRPSAESGKNARPTRALAAWAVMIVVMAVVMLPWVLRNYRLFGHVIPTTLQVGESLYEANSPHADGGPAMDRIDWVKERGGGPMGEYENNEFFKAAALRYVREHPGRFCRLAVEKFKRFWNPVPNYGPYRTPLYLVISLCASVPVFMLALVGIVKYAALWLRRPRRSYPSQPANWRVAPHRFPLLLAPIIYQTGLHVVFVGSVRYRIPVMPFVILLAAAGAEAVWRRHRRGGPQETPPASAGLQPFDPAHGPEHAEGRKRRRKWLRWFVWPLVLIAAALGILWGLFLTPERLRATARQAIARVTLCHVEIQSAEFALTRGVVLRGITAMDPRSVSGKPVLKIDMLTLRPRWTSLFTGGLVWRRVSVERPEIRAELDENGEWPLLKRMRLGGQACPRPLGLGGGIVIPRVDVHAAEVQIVSQAAEGYIPNFEFSPLDATVRPTGKEGTEADVVVESARSGFGRLRVAAHFSARPERTDGKIWLYNLPLGPKLRDALPASCRAEWDAWNPSGRLDLQARFHWTPAAERSFHYDGEALLYDAGIRNEILPHPITELKAQIGFNDQVFRISSIRARAGQAALYGAGAVRFTSRGRMMYDFSLTAEGMRTDKSLREKLPPGARDIWNRANPSGVFNVAAKISRGRYLPLELSADVELLDMDFAPQESPVAFTHVAGRIGINRDGLTIQGITGKAGGAPFSVSLQGEPFTIQGGSISFKKNGPFELSGRVDGLKLSGAFDAVVPTLARDRLPASIQEFLQKAAITVVLDASFKAVRLPGRKDAQIEADAAVRDMTFSHPALAAPFTGLNTRVRYASGEISLTRTSANWGPGRLEIPATRVDLAPSATKCFRIKVANLPLEQVSRGLAPASLQDLLQKATVAGELEISLKPVRPATERESRIEADVTLMDMTVTHPRLATPLSKLNASAQYLRQELALGPTTAHWGQARLEIPATRIRLALSAAKSLEMKVTNVKLNQELRDLLPRSFLDRWNESGAAGTIDVDFKLERPEGADAPVHTHAVVCLREAQMRYVGFPYLVRDVDGRFEVVDGVFKHAEFAGGSGDARIRLTIDPQPSGQLHGVRDVLHVVNGRLDRDVRDALPKGFQLLWDALKPEGALNLDLVIDRYWRPEGGGDISRFTADAVLPALSLQAGVPMKIAGGRVTIEEGHADASGKVTVSGRIQFDDARLEPVRLDHLTAAYRLVGQTLTIDEVDAGCYGGRLSGSLLIPGAPNGDSGIAADEFRGSLILAGASVVKITEGTEIKNIAGRLNATSTFSGSLVSPEDFSAIGAMTIREGKIGALPGLLAPLNLLLLQRLRAPAFTELELAYEVRGPTLKAHEINLLGNVLSLHGEGTVEKGGKVNFRFIPEIGPQIPRIPGIQDVLDAVKGIVVPITVQGDPNDPVWRLNPILSLTRAAQKALMELILFRRSTPAKEPKGPEK